MAYFSNGSEGMDYVERFCSRCVHGKKDCAVWSAHLQHAYEECNNDGKTKPLTNAKNILDLLIPMKHDEKLGYSTAQECTLFIQREGATHPDQTEFGFGS